MPETSNKELNSAADQENQRNHDLGYDPVRGHAIENQQQFLPDMTAPGAGEPDGPADDGSAGGPTYIGLPSDSAAETASKA